MEPNRPSGRKKKVTGSSEVFKREEKIQTNGPVGGGQSNPKPRRPQQQSFQFEQDRPDPSNSQRPHMSRAAKTGGISIPLVIVVVLVLYFVLGRGGCGGTVSQTTQSGSNTLQETTSQGSAAGDTTSSNASNSGSSFSGGSGNGSDSGSASNASASAGGFGIPYLFGNGSGSSWSDANYATAATQGELNTNVAPGSREKYTRIIGNGQDKVTMLVYMCGTDLESQNSMATSDLQEMVNATIGNNLNIIVYTGGCARWNNSIISNQYNQIYRIQSGGLERIYENAGTASMVEPDTLSSFIRWGAQKYPADRYELIFWDHGGGTISGYGYDEKNKRAGSMDLAEISKALRDGGIKFDFVGFDACLMATAETALMLNDYADYMIASEETEPGIGWYYTNWVTSLSNNTSMSTLDIGKSIADDFTSTCATNCRGQQTTLSVIDLAEFSHTVPSTLKAFSQSIRNLIANKQYQTVSDARYGSKEFGASSRIDQIDLIHFAENIGTAEGLALSSALKDAVKYNRTQNLTNAYGVSIFFPYQRAAYVDTVVHTYKNINMDEEYTSAIREFASLQTSGQVSSGGSYSPFGSLFGDGYTSGSSGSTDTISELLGGLLSGGGSSGGDFGIGGLSGGNTDFFGSLFGGRSLAVEDVAEYIADNQFAGAELEFKQAADGSYYLSLTPEQWRLVHGLDQNFFFDDGSGYLDLGLDNLYDFDDEGNLIADTEGTWLAIDGHPVAYYHETTVDDGTDFFYTGRVPALLNGELVDLMIVIDGDTADGRIVGARRVYDEEETMVQAKALIELQDGDELDFVCDFYDYDGHYKSTYPIGDPITVSGEPEVSNVVLTGGTPLITYRFTDIYNQVYWTNSITP